MEEMAYMQASNLGKVTAFSSNHMENTYFGELYFYSQPPVYNPQPIETPKPEVVKRPFPLPKRNFPEINSQTLKQLV